MRHRSPRLTRWLVAPAALVPTLAVGGLAGSASPVGADVGTCTTGPPAVVDPGFVRPTLDQAVPTVRAFAELQIGMEDPIVGTARPVPGDPNRATVEVRNRREDGTPGVSTTNVVVRQQFDRWVVESATSPSVSIEVPIGGSLVVIGHDLPVSGRASAWEGTVPIDVVTDGPGGPIVVGEGTATAAGLFDAPYATEIPVTRGPTGDGSVIATTTTGTDQGPPAFAVVPIELVDAVPVPAA